MREANDSLQSGESTKESAKRKDTNGYSSDEDETTKFDSWASGAETILQNHSINIESLRIQAGKDPSGAFDSGNLTEVSLNSSGGSYSKVKSDRNVYEKTLNDIIEESSFQDEPDDSSMKSPRSKARFLFILVLLFFVVGFAIIAFLNPPDQAIENDSIEQQGEGNGKDTHIPPYPLTHLVDFNISIIYSISPVAALSDPNSPQYKAFQFLSSPDQPTTYSQQKLLQRYILATFYFALNGPKWDTPTNSWLQPSQDECFWDGIACSELSLTPSQLYQPVTMINLPRFNLVGQLPSETSHLSYLTQFLLPDNDIGGKIPSQISLLSHLTHLDFSYNQLTSTIPTGFSGMTSLLSLDLAFNHLDGPIPQSFGNIPHLSVIDLSNNHLSGTFPLSLSNLDSLSHLILDDNDIEGNLPPLIFEITSLQTLSLSNNEMFGPIPQDNIGILTNLQILHLDGNEFSGKIPASLAQLPMIQELTLQKNNLEGNVPISLCEVSSLTRLSADCEGEDAPVFCSCCTDCY